MAGGVIADGEHLWNVRLTKGKIVYVKTCRVPRLPLDAGYDRASAAGSAGSGGW